jgi:hypothetical protein
MHVSWAGDAATPGIRSHGLLLCRVFWEVVDVRSSVPSHVLSFLKVGRQRASVSTPQLTLYNAEPHSTFRLMSTFSYLAERPN